MHKNSLTRREFLKRSALGAAGTAAALGVGSVPYSAKASPLFPRASSTSGSVAILQGSERADNAFRVMQVFKQEIAWAIGNKRVVIKPNVLNDTVTLADTSVDWLEGILEFLMSIGKTDVIIAECSSHGTMMAFGNMGYLRLADKYPVRFVDLGQEPGNIVYTWATNNVTNATAISPAPTNLGTVNPILVTGLFSDPNNFVISCPRIKTHNNAVMTAGVKCIAMGSALIDPGYSYSQSHSNSNKSPGMHGEPNYNQVLNDNIYRLAAFYGIHPSLSVIDGWQGMQGYGPNSGTGAAEQKLAIASFDYVAADRVAAKIIGTDNWYKYYYCNTAVLNLAGGLCADGNTRNGSGNNPTAGTGDCPMFPAYLNYLGQAGLGTWDISQITDAQTGGSILATLNANPAWLQNFYANPRVSNVTTDGTGGSFVELTNDDSPATGIRYYPKELPSTGMGVFAPPAASPPPVTEPSGPLPPDLPSAYKPATTAYFVQSAS